MTQVYPVSRENSCMRRRSSRDWQRLPRSATKQRQREDTPLTSCTSASVMPLWLHSGMLLYQQRASPLPLGKTLLLATVTVDICCAWALCSRGEHCNALFYN